MAIFVIGNLAFFVWEDMDLVIYHILWQGFGRPEVFRHISKCAERRVWTMTHKNKVLEAIALPLLAYIGMGTVIVVIHT